MSLITQCPACATMFKVVPDQLRISDGWVRCGQCDEVFDANAHLYADPDTPSAVEAAPPDAPVPADTAWVSSLKFDTQEAVDSVAVDGTTDGAGDEPVIESPAEDVDAVVETPDVVVAELEALDPVMALSPGLSPDSVPPPEDISVPLASDAPAPRYAQAQVKVSKDTDPHKLSFMRQARRKSLWRHVVVRLSLAILSLALLAGLALQVVVLERDRIAAMEPDSRVPLEALCEVLGCKIQTLRKIDEVVIDSSAFSKVQGDVYRLNFTLKSTSSLPLALPALELTLTDMQDQAVLRRVVGAKEVSASTAVLEPGSELSVVLPLRVKTGAGEARISGYRLLAFYP